MPTIATVGGVRIMIFAMDHNPPHFHAVFGRQEVQIRIADLSVLAGRLPPAKLRAVLVWARLNQASLAFHWSRLSGG